MTESTDQPRVGFLGTGRMATALAGGLVSAGFTTPGRLVGSDVVAEAAKAFAEATGGATVDTNLEVLAAADVVVLSVKPQDMAGVLAEIGGQLTDGHLVVSIAAGITLATLAEGLGDDRRLVRVMPNTPCLVGLSASAFAVGGVATEADALLVERFLSTVGLALRVDESLLDAVTGLSGSGPAYIYQVIDAMAAGGVQAGLDPDIALQLAVQTARGAAEMIRSTGQAPAALTEAVASPGGTTLAGLAKLEQGQLRETLIAAVTAATTRSKELGAN